MFNEENIINTLIAGSMVFGFMGLLVAGFWQEIKITFKEDDKN